MASVSATLLLTVVLACATAADARDNLRGQAAERKMNESDVEAAIMDEYSALHQVGSARQKLAKLEKALKPMYAAVPKEKDGGSLSHAVVRYVLHRYFEQTHGWWVRGLEPGNASAIVPQFTNMKYGNLPFVLEKVTEWMPAYMQKFLEQLQGGEGIKLPELAVLAATFEDLIHKEAGERLEMTYTALELPFNTSLSQARMREALEVYLMIYMLGGNFTITGRHSLLRAHKIFTVKVEDWIPAQKWMHDVQEEVAPSSLVAANFSSAARVVEEVSKRYGKYNENRMCIPLKDQLLKMESTKAGRVRMTDFYKAGTSGAFDFSERIEYLRILGVIDESDAAEPYLIVPNYLASRSNCLKSSSLYAVCCRNECEEAMGTIEAKFQSPEADPQQIIDLVSSISTKTITAPRKLKDSMVKRLKTVASANEGKVPIHGRMFAQWMHHAFPRECPYPQASGASAPVSADEWLAASGQERARKTTEQLQMVVDSHSRVSPMGAEARAFHDLEENDLPWDEMEELLVPIVKRKYGQQLDAALPSSDALSWEVPAEEEVTTIKEVEVRSMFKSDSDSLPSMHLAACASGASFLASIAVLVWKIVPRKGRSFLSIQA